MDHGPRRDDKTDERRSTLPAESAKRQAESSRESVKASESEQRRRPLKGKNSHKATTADALKKRLNSHDGWCEKNRQERCDS
ncbi:hypothetical protein [Erwinia sp. PsM31]|uniref:hypothetical protein n=1 Tax=Erwinia sp. PsM31 TaxID=3030535 RepID=UPI00263B529C|nr:hypothetical protein [Erwinia sp. PsM31]MDN4625650.1 hypothetical protein [Erwinia sp. PsM31]